MLRGNQYDATVKRNAFEGSCPVRSTSVVDSGCWGLDALRCRARLEMFAWCPRSKVGVSRKLWMKLKTRCLDIRCV